MKRQDYVALNVPGLLQRYANPTEAWQKKILALARTQLDLLKKYEFINSGATAFHVPVEQLMIRFSDYTKLGQEFVLTGAIDKWMASCDRKGNLEAYENKAPLEKRILAFLKTTKSHAS